MTITTRNLTGIRSLRPQLKARLSEFAAQMESNEPGIFADLKKHLQGVQQKCDVSMRILERLKKVRQKRKLTLDQVSICSGIARETLCRLEGQKIVNPTIHTLQRIAAALDFELQLKLIPTSKTT